MFKTKLQELCHQKAWNLPEYSTTKGGLGHNPHFDATVTVNGHSFSTSSPAKSSKLAQNEAAKLAFDHLSRPPAAATIAATTADGSDNNGAVRVNVQESDQNDAKFTAAATIAATTADGSDNNGAVGVNVQESDQNDAKFTEDVEHLSKSLLQSYAQKKGLTLPIYATEREGPPHASRFKCKVTVDNQTYKCPDFFPSLSKAEHAAAKVALMFLAPHGVEEDESAYKNLLQELAQKKGWQLPTYSTNTSGESHKPTFVSTVEVEGEIFSGQETRTKKQAELSAAKVAYRMLKSRFTSQTPMATNSSIASRQHVGPASEITGQSHVACPSSNLKQRPFTYLGKSSQSDQSPSPPRQRQKVVQITSSSSPSDFLAYLQQNIQPKMPGCGEHAMEQEGMDKVRGLHPISPPDVTSHGTLTASPGPESCSMTKTSPSRSPSPFIPPLPKLRPPASSSPMSSSTNLAVSSGMEHSTVENTLRHNKVIVHPRSTNMAHPVGSTVLPMSDDNWVAVGLPQSSQ